VDREPVRSVGTRTMIDVLKSVLFTRRTSEDDLTEIERGSSVRMVCVPVHVRDLTPFRRGCLPGSSA
jgi:hypothetical protein